MKKSKKPQTEGAPEAPAIAVHCSHDELVPVGELKPHPGNPNKHPAKQVELLAKIIRTQGWRAPIVVSRRSGFVVTGHGRLSAAKLLQVATVPVNFQQFETEAQETAHLLADNQIAELAEIDDAALREALVSLKDIGADMDLTGFTGEALDKALEDLPDGNDVSSPPKFNISYTIAFEDTQQQEAWYDLLRVWRQRFGELPLGQLIQRAFHEEGSKIP